MLLRPSLQLRLACTVATLAVLLLPDPAAAQKREVCVGERLERGWIVVDAKWSATKCGPTEGVQDNVWVIEKFADKPAGSTLQVCASQRTPSGWETVSSRWNPTTCESVEGMQDTVKVIRRVDDPGDTEALVDGILGAIFGGDDDDESLGDPGDDSGRRRITGVYSDMGRVEESGDIIGTEIFLIYSTDGMEGRYYALVQFAEGVPEPPQLVEVDVSGSRVQFSAFFMGYRMQFAGRVSENTLEGEFDGPVGKIELQRRNSFWQ